MIIIFVLVHHGDTEGAEMNNFSFAVDPAILRDRYPGKGKPLSLSKITGFEKGRKNKSSH